jgi:DNA-binding protein H-NS
MVVFYLERITITLHEVNERREKVAKFGEHALALIKDGIDPYDLHSAIQTSMYSDDAEQQLIE